MSNLEKQTRDFMREKLSPYTTRPIGAFVFTDPEASTTGDDDYSVVLSSTTISITDGITSFIVTYVNKSSRQVASELNSSQFPIQVKAVVNIQNLEEGDLVASGSLIPGSFDDEDRLSTNSVIVRAKRYAVAYDRLTNINILPPYRDTAAFPWWARVVNGEFSQDYKGVTYRFSIPEYVNQTWSDTWGRPFMDVVNEPTSLISAGVVQVSRFPLLWKNGNIVISVGNTKVLPSSSIKDVDTMNGLVYLKEGITLPRDASISYTHYQNSYIYKGINLNGHFNHNPYILDKYIVIYALPTWSSNGLSRIKGIYHSVGEIVFDAVNTIQTDRPDEPIAILGAINVKSHYDPRDITIVDTRSYGGGLTEDGLGIATEKKFKQSQYFFDVSKLEGIPYPGAASVIIELPPELKEIMPLNDIIARASKYLAVGVYPIYNFKEEYIPMITNSGTVDISLLQYEPLEANEITGQNESNVLRFTTSAATGDNYGWGQSTWIHLPDANENTTVQLDKISTENNPDGSSPVELIRQANGTTVGLYIRSTFGTPPSYLEGPDGDLVLLDDPTIPGFLSEAQTASCYMKSRNAIFSSMTILDRLKSVPGEPISVHQIAHTCVWEWKGPIGNRYPTIYSTQNMHPADSYHVEYMGNSWFRFSLTYNATGELDNPLDPIGSLRQVFFRPSALGNLGIGDTYGKGSYLWGMQLEDNSYPTSYVANPDLYLDSVDDYYGRLYGGVGQAANWLSSSKTIPASGIYYELDALEFTNAPFVTHENNESYIQIESGEKFYQKYIKSSPDAKFYYEYRGVDDQWRRTAITDSRDVADGVFLGGTIELDGTLGYKEVRNFTGLCPYNLTTIDNGDVWDVIANASARIVSDAGQLTHTTYAIATGYVPDVTLIEYKAKEAVIPPGIDSVYKVLSKHQDTCLRLNIFDDGIDKVSNYLHEQTATISFPRSYNYITNTSAGSNSTEVYNAFEDAYAGLRLATHRMNLHSEGATYGSPSVNHLILGNEDTHIPYITTVPDPIAQEAVRGSYGIIRNILSIHPYVGVANNPTTDVISPYFIPSGNSEVGLATNGYLAEANRTLNQLHLRAEYARLFGSVYATMLGPIESEAPDIYYTDLSPHPLDIAFSGAAMSLIHFNDYIQPVTLNGVKVNAPFTWLSDYGRLCSHGGQVLDAVAETIDHMLIGNNEWAGILNTGDKVGPYYDPIEANFDEYKYDTHAFNTTVQQVPFPSSEESWMTYTIAEGCNHLVERYYNIIRTQVEPYLRNAVRRGGILEPGYIKLIRSLIWMPIRAQQGLTPFIPGENSFTFEDFNYDKLVETFIEALNVAVKSSISADGLLIEDGSYKHDHAPFPGSMPCELLKACSDAVTWYDLIGDIENKRKWLGIGLGLVKTTISLYELPGGYPYDPRVLDSPSEGDNGAKVLDGYLSLLRHKATPFTDTEVNIFLNKYSARFQ